MVNAQLTIRCLASNNSRPLCVSRIFRGDFYNIFHNMLAFSLIVDGQILKNVDLKQITQVILF